MEPGGPNVMACLGLLEGLRTINLTGIAAIAAHVRTLQRMLLDALAGVPVWVKEVHRLRGLLDRDRLGPILCFHHGDMNPADLQELLHRGFRRGVYGSAREGYLRVAFHGWHQETDVHRVVDWLKS